MKAAIISDFVIVRRVLAQSILAYAIVGAMLSAWTKSPLALAACLSGMTPFLVMFTLTAYDGTGGWERFRSCLPMTRTDVVVGRYVNVLASALGMATVATFAVWALVQAATSLPIPADLARSFESESDLATIAAASFGSAGAVLLAAAAAQPFMTAFGLTKGTRMLPVAIVFLIPVAAYFLGDGSALGQAAEFASDGRNAPLVATGAVLVVLAAFAASCAVSVAVYRRKDL